MTGVTAIVLAAGQSLRMGTPKLLLPYRGAPLLTHTLALVAGYPFFRRVLVANTVVAAAIVPPPGFETYINPDPARGQSSSIAIGVRAAVGSAYMFFAGDQPLLTGDTVRRLLERFEPGAIVYPVCAGKPCSPALFCARFRDELLALTGDTGGREVRAAHPDACVPVDTADARELRDADTPEDYRQLLRF